MELSESGTFKITADADTASLDFSLEALRFLVAVIAQGLPFLVFFIIWTITSSISASYYTRARDVFVGSLFVIGALFWAYEGHPEPKSIERQESKLEKWAAKIGGLPKKAVSILMDAVYAVKKALYQIPESLVGRIGGVAAIIAALFPTACDFCKTEPRSVLHYVAATILFSSIVYFCLVAFWYRVKQADTSEVEKKRRGRIYLICGWLIAATMLALIAAQFTVPEAIRVSMHLTYFAETFSMELFGFAWLTASKVLPPLASEQERYHPFGKRTDKEKRQTI